MPNLVKIIGLTATYLQVKQTYIKGFTAFTELNFKTERVETLSKAFRIFITEGGIKKLAIDKYYWINTVHQDYINDPQHEAILGDKSVILAVNLLLGNLIDSKYTRTVKYTVEEVDNPLTLWSSGDIIHVSKKIDIPQMSVKHLFLSDNKMQSNITLSWKKDADFNHNSKGIKIKVTIRAYNSMQVVQTFMFDTVGYVNSFTFNDVEKESTFIFETTIVDTKGIVLLSNSYYHVHVDQPVNLYIKRINKIVQPHNVYFKVGENPTVIKKINSISAKY